MDLRPIDPAKLDTLRNGYRRQLAIPVVSDFHEALCQMGQAWGIEDMGRMLGYILFAKETFLPAWDPMIPEFHLGLEQTKNSRAVLEKIFDILQPATVMSRTDDIHGFPLLMDMRLPNEVAASLYGLEREPSWSEDEEVRIELSSMEHAQELSRLYASVKPEDGGIPDGMALTKSLALWDHYRLMREGRAVAVCYAVPQSEGYVTTACIVDAAFRQKGYGRYLTAYTIRRSLAKGQKFIAVAPVDNEAAKGLVESLGARLKAQFVNFKP